MTTTPATQPSVAQPSDEEVQAAIHREQQAQMSYLHDRVLQMSITNARLEAENASLRAAANSSTQEGPA